MNASLFVLCNLAVSDHLLHSRIDPARQISEPRRQLSVMYRFRRGWLHIVPGIRDLSALASGYVFVGNNTNDEKKSGKKQTSPLSGLWSSRRVGWLSPSSAIARKSFRHSRLASPAADSAPCLATVIIASGLIQLAPRHGHVAQDEPIATGRLVLRG